MLRALNIANTILDKAFNERIPITQMKLQKLIYILYKEYLQRTKKSLFGESFQAWKYGPVLTSVYDQFKQFKGNNIDEYYYIYIDGKKYYEKVNLKSSEEFTNILESVWNEYKNYSGIELSRFTHQEGTAWDKAIKTKKYILSDEDILKEDRYV